MDELCTCLSDPGDLAGGSEDDLEFLLLSFNTNTENKWFLEKAFGLPLHGYRSAATKVPFLQEIRDAIVACKPTAKSRAARSRTEVVAVAVRDHNFLVLSDPRGVTLAFRKQENNTVAPADLEFLQWFLEALERDVLAVLNPARRLVGVADDPDLEKVADDPDLEKAPEDSEALPAKGEGDEVPEDSEAPLAKRTKVQVYADTALVHIREHAKCSSASWLPSRGSFKINTTDKTKARKEFRVQGIAKLLKEAEARGDDQSWLSVNDKISNKATEVLEYLDEIPDA